MPKLTPKQIKCITVSLIELNVADIYSRIDAGNGFPY